VTRLDWGSRSYISAQEPVGRRRWIDQSMSTTISTYDSTGEPFAVINMHETASINVTCGVD